MKKNSSNIVPVIFLAFANHHNSNEEGFLRNLAQEEKQIREALSLAIKEGLCQLEVSYNCDLEDIFNIFQDERFRNRIAIFHFGGHANSYQLLLQSSTQKLKYAHAEGLVPFLGRQSALELVFFNGCSTQRQALQLNEANIPMAIGTVKGVSDKVACRLASRFYHGIGQGLSIGQSWEDATSIVLSNQGSDLRGLYREKANQSHFPWILEIRPGNEASKKWSLPIANNNPLFGLPDLSPYYDLPYNPYRYLEKYSCSDSRIFFGRGKAIKELYERITNRTSDPIITIFGRSGIGKSSLLEAGLIPRLKLNHKVYFYRKTKGVSLLVTLGRILQVDSYDPTDLLKAWKQLENQAKSGSLVIIFDQVELLFSQGNSIADKEIGEFLQALSFIFNNPQDRPKGKVILSLRKEYIGEIKQAFLASRVPFEDFFLDKLSEKSILEIINGLTSTIALQRKYRLNVDPQLPNIIASDLLADSDSSIAPMLQIILTKLWVNQSNKAQKYFDRASYQKLKKEGLLLRDFFHQQMHKLMPSNEGIFTRGLALDILFFHTTKKQTSCKRSLSEIKDQYPHQADQAIKLVLQLQQLHLLTGYHKDTTILAHDTLAPIIINEINESENPGSRAQRILKHKLLDFQQNSTTIIESQDLAVVEEGALEMRSWTPLESQLIECSRLARDLKIRRDSKYQLFKNLAIIGLVSLLILSVFFGNSTYQQAKVNGLISLALQQEKEDATLALGTINEALKIKSDHKGALQTRSNIYQHNEFYQSSMTLSDAANCIAISDFNRLLATSVKNKVYIWGKQNQLIDSLLHPDEVTSIAFLPNNSQFLSVCKDNIIRLWDSEGRTIQQFIGHEDWVNDLVISKNGSFFVSASRDGTIKQWSFELGLQKTFDLTLNARQALYLEVLAVALSPSSDTIITGDSEGKVITWSKSGHQLDEYHHQDKVLTLNYSSNGNYFASSSRDGSVAIQQHKQKTLRRFQLHTKRINSIQFSPDGSHFLTASDDKSIRLWTLDGEPRTSYQGHTDFVHSIVFSNDGQYFWSTSEDKTIKKWKLDSKNLRLQSFTSISLIPVSISSDRQYIAVIEDSVNQLFDLSVSEDPFPVLENSNPHPFYTLNPTNGVLQEFIGHQGRINALTFSPNSQYVLSGSTDSTARLWSADGRLVNTFQHQEWVNSLAISPDNSQIITSSSDSTIYIWSSNGKIQKSIPHPAFASSVAYAPNGKFFITACHDGKVRIYNQEGNLKDSIEFSDGYISSLAISPDNQYLAVGQGGLKAAISLTKFNGNLVFQKEMNETNNTGGKGVKRIRFSNQKKWLIIELEGGLVKGYNRKGLELWTTKGGFCTEPTNFIF